MERIITAALIGFSSPAMGGIFTLGASTVNWKLGGKFLVGRFLGLIFVGVLIGLLGQKISIPPRIMRLIFGFTALAFGIWLIFKKAHPNPNIGLAMGFFRGMTPCTKIILVVPLIIGSHLWETALTMVVFAGASSIYPVVALSLAIFGKKLFKQQRTMRYIGATIIIMIGLFNIILPWGVMS